MDSEPLIGCILGTAVGDALGLPYEGLSRKRAARLLGAPDRHRFFFGRGMISDDTEHTCIVAQALISAQGDIKQFQRSLAWGLRWWLLGLPAGIGIATLKSGVRLLLGVSPERSGVFSAGNGPAMRAAILGVSISDVAKLREFIRVSTRITHTDPKAELGAFAIALAAQLAARKRVLPQDYLAILNSSLGDESPEFMALMTRVIDSVQRAETTLAFADSMGLLRGVSGYMYHSVPIVIHAWLSHPCDYRGAVQTVIRCGGDTDSTAAMVGGIVGGAVGRLGIPQEWLATLFEWPRTVNWMEDLGRRLAVNPTTHAGRWAPRLTVLGLGLRNLFFLVVVLFHGFRRLAPPY